MCFQEDINRQCECIIGGITIDNHVDNATDYPVINWLNQLNKSVIEAYMTKRRRNSTGPRQAEASKKLMSGSTEIGKK